MGYYQGDSFPFSFEPNGIPEFHLDQNQKENCHHDYILFNVKGNGNIVFSVYRHTFFLRFSCTDIHFSFTIWGTYGFNINSLINSSFHVQTYIFCDFPYRYNYIFFLRDMRDIWVQCWWVNKFFQINIISCQALVPQNPIVIKAHLLLKRLQNNTGCPCNRYKGWIYQEKLCNKKKTYLNY